jgi:hypothetical protein
MIVSEAGDGDLTLIAESGDIVLGGGIIVLPTESPLALRISPAPAMARPLAAPTGGQARRMSDSTVVPAARGGSISIHARNGNVIIDSAHFMIAGDGESAQPMTVDEVPAAVLDISGPAGGEGGHILLRVDRGAVVFRPRRPDDPPPFHIGNGGAGADLHLAPQVGGSLGSVVGGDGGRSGHFEISATRIDGAGGVRRFFAQGRGGDGGDVTWRPEVDPAPMSEKFVLGGNAGHAQLSGGNGGSIFYEGTRLRTAHDAAHEPPKVRGIGGRGGAIFDLFPLMGPDEQFTGGRGGDARVVGIHGWHGTAPDQLDGGSGGGVEVSGAVGGWVPSHPNARAGDGGNVSAVSGDGGNGANRCGVGQGGRGGRPGRLEARGGRGGDVTGAQPVLGRGGNGGHVVRAAVGFQGHGGRGEPPGAAGDLPTADEVSVTSGVAGSGSEPGIIGSVPEISFGIAADPRGCDETDPGPVTPPDYCGPHDYRWSYRVDVTLGMTFAATGERVYSNGTSRVSLNQTWDYTATGRVQSASILLVPDTFVSAAAVSSVIRTETLAGTTIFSRVLQGSESASGTTRPDENPNFRVPSITVELDRRTCLWTIAYGGGKLKVTDEINGRPGESLYDLGSVRLRTSEATGSRSLAWTPGCRLGDATCEGHLGSGLRDWAGLMPDVLPPPINLHWAITVTPVLNP